MDLIKKLFLAFIILNLFFSVEAIGKILVSDEKAIAFYKDKENGKICINNNQNCSSERIHEGAWVFKGNIKNGDIVFFLDEEKIIDIILYKKEDGKKYEKVFYIFSGAILSFISAFFITWLNNYFKLDIEERTSLIKWKEDMLRNINSWDSNSTTDLEVIEINSPANSQKSQKINNTRKKIIEIKNQVIMEEKSKNSATKEMKKLIKKLRI